MSSTEVDQVQSHPDKLSPLWLSLVKIGIPLGFILMTFGGFGLWVLTDEKKESFITNSKFGEIYLLIHGINPMFTAVFVNGGLLMLIMSFAKLSNHNRVVKGEETAKKELAKQQESKKTK